ncbi:Glycosyltransferase involved in cell wall bisynthesis [Fodinibius salinus]|uniref:Glycosyltransferase involved in cell wall bisynthesis n=1 Tax=Fodinibius salinus TaxID=860790 RepID=A0A5D3YHH7_9BACT|nr:glycosyltransferase family 1 protein [Fodinibius salinus]TYP92649.1 Glycosyltransferase involved in cell wall bisynthesis [Fodinibius salinus]
MSDLRVAIFTGNYNHIQDGVSLTLNRLVAYLEEQDIPVLVFGPTVDEPEIDHEGEFVSVPSVPMPGRQEYRITVGFPDAAQRRLHEFEPTLIHLATPDLLGFRAMRWAQGNDIQIVSSYHTHFTSYLKYYNLGMLKMLGWKYLEWFYSQCKHIYVPSPSMANELNEEGIDEGIRIWARGVNTDQFSPDFRDMEWRRSVGFDDDDRVVTFVSRLVWEKNLQTFVDTVKKLQQTHQNIKPMIVGDGPALKELEHMLTDAHFTGFITGDELSRAYASSDVFLFPSETETFGNVTLEAMSSGLPCVVADATGSRSLVESGVNGFLAPPRDTEVFAECIEKIVEDDELATEMGEAARQKALAYSWDNVNGKLLDNYREALDEPRPALKF